MDTDEEDDHMHVPMEEVAENVMKGHSELTSGKSETDDLLLKSVSSNWSKTGRRSSGTAVAAAQILTSISRGETFPMISPNNLTAVNVMDGQDQRLVDVANSVEVEQPIQKSSYNCSICDRSFATSRGLGIHRSNHNKDKKMTMKIKPRKLATNVLKADEDRINKTLVPVLDDGDGAMQSTAGPRTMEKKIFDLNQPCDMEDDDHQGLHTQVSYIDLSL